MAKFKKKIVRPGTPTVGRLDGSEEKEPLTPARLKSWVDNTKLMQSHGFLIPGPLAHQDKNKRFALPVIKAKDGETLADAYSGANAGIPPAWDLANLNAGYWEDFEIDPADGSIVGVLDAENKAKSDMIGTDVKQTSVLVMPGRRITDSLGVEHEVGEHFAHVAVCLHAQEPGQENFQPIAPLSPLSPIPAGMAMSFVLAMDEMQAGGTNQIKDLSGGLPQNPNTPKDPELYAVIGLLRSAKNLAIPEDTTRENFLQVLKIVLTQALASDQEAQKDEQLNTRPSDGQTKTPSIAMTQTVQKTAEPVTQDKAAAILMSMLVKDKKKVLKERIAKLISTGRVGKAYADANLYPKAEAFSMSASDLTESGEFPKGSLEDLLDGLEQATPLVGESLLSSGNYMNDVPTDGQVEGMPIDVITGTSDMNDLTDAQMEALLDGSSL